MRNYVIINGVNSLTIKGLAINELPPIVKAPMRVLQEEIDGRDGDIITDLGYGAYDKIMTIGLYDGYDINEIIAFFNNEGTIVFSDEADKYYNFKIIEQIDYERLIKFRTASITFHCQPFKYPLTETPVEITNEYVEAEGTSITLTPTAEAPISIDLKGNTSQASVPTPDSPVDVNVVSGDNTIVVEGKNRFNLDWVEYRTNNGITATKEDDHILLTGIATASAYINFTIPSDIFENDSYTWFAKSDTTLTYGIKVLRSSGGNVDISPTTSWVKSTFNSSNVTGGYLYIANGTNLSSGCKIYIDTRKGNIELTDYSYTPYVSQTQLISLGTIELNKIGNYQDYFYKTDKWYKHSKVGKKIVTENEIIAQTDSYTNVKYFRINKESDDIDYNKFNATNILYSSATLNNGYNYDSASMIGKINPTAEATRYWIGFPKSATTSEAQEKLTGSVLYYPLATETDTEITDSTLISQLDNIKNMTSYNGTTNISQENNDEPFIISAKAMKQGSGTATITNSGNIYSKPTIDIEGTGIVDVYIGANQIFSVNVDEEVIIDSTNLEAYKPDGTLANRNVTGNIANLKLPTGNSTISVDGDIDKATITNYTRWL